MQCGLCGESDKSADNMMEDLELIVEHMRVVHPDYYGEGPKRWPDGELAVFDETLEPIDFEE